MNHEGVNRFTLRQLGLITGAQARRAGLTPEQVHRLLRTAEWRLIRPSVYAVAGMPPSFEQSLLAVTLSVGRAALISHRTAAVLWQLKGFTSHAIEVSAPIDRKVRLEGVSGHRSTLLFDDDRTYKRRVPVTSLARTIVDLSGAASVAALGAATDDALRRGLRLHDLRRCVHRLPPGPGRRISLLHEVLAARLPGYDPGESDLETRVLRLLVSAGISPPRQQYRVRHRGGSCRLDMASPELLIAIELDGWYPHGTNRSVFDHDRSRANALVLGGWLVLRFTSRTSDEEVLESVTAALALRSAA